MVLSHSEEFLDVDAESGEGLQSGPAPVVFRSATSLRRTWTAGRIRTLSTDLLETDDHFVRQLREKNEETKALIIAGIQQTPFCSGLDDAELQAIFDAMEWFTFNAGDVVVKEGEVGRKFFVAHEGVLEVSVDGKVTRELHAGDGFGADALLYNCCRTATVIAQEDAGIWGADGDVFREVLREHGEKCYAENRALLDRIRLFDGLPAKQKEHIGQLALYTEAFEARARIVTEGEAATAMYFVKEGEPHVVKGGASDACGNWTGGALVSKLQAGDWFGEGAAMADAKNEHTVLAGEGRCVLVCISLQQLRDVFGQDLVLCLQRVFVISVLKQIPVFANLSPAQQHKMVEAMETKRYGPGHVIEEALHVIVVVEGEIVGTRENNTVVVQSGQWYEGDAFAQLEAGDGRAVDGDGLRVVPGHNACGPSLRGLTAGPCGAVVAVLRMERLSAALKTFGVADIGGTDEAMDYMRKMLLAKKVAIFRDLSEEKIDAFVESLVVRRYTRGAQVIQTGEVGSAVYVVAKGELSVYLNGNCVRVIGKAGIFGEREILFDEPRVATVEVSSEEAELWAMDRPSFLCVVTGQMREELVHQIRLQDRSVTMKSLKHVRVIGVGSFGSVRLVQHTRTNLKYALKRIKKESGEVPPVVQQECAILAGIEHPFVVSMVKTFETSTSIYILMEVVTGGSLYDQMKKIGVFNREQGRFFIVALVLILESMHEQNIIYRDLKPENVMLDDRGYPKLIDFGLAKRLDSAASRTFTVAGTVYYIAPEIIRGRGYGVEADLWSLGVLIYELLCGCFPFGDEHDEQSDIVAAILQNALEFPRTYVDRDGQKLISGLLRKQPGRRLGAGFNGRQDVREAGFFKDGVPRNLFNQILGRELKAPIIPEGECHVDSNTTDTEACLSDMDELGGDEEFFVDNCKLQAPTAGLVYRRSKCLEDRDLDSNTDHPVWGSTIVGRSDSEWVRVGKRFLPMSVDRLPVLVPKLYLVDNTWLQAATAGLVYRLSKRLDDRDMSATTVHPPWGSTVAGMEEEGGWLRVADRYLPMSVDGVTVLTAVKREKNGYAPIVERKASDLAYVRRPDFAARRVPVNPPSMDFTTNFVAEADNGFAATALTHDFQQYRLWPILSESSPRLNIAQGGAATWPLLAESSPRLKIADGGSGPWYKQANHMQQGLLRRRFMDLDQDGGRRVSRHEVRYVLDSIGSNITEVDLNRVFMAVDRTGDGCIDYEDFIAFLYRR